MLWHSVNMYLSADTAGHQAHPVQTDTLPPCDALVLHAGMPRPSTPVPGQGTIVITSFTNVMRRVLTRAACDCTNARLPAAVVCERVA